MGSSGVAGVVTCGWIIRRVLPPNRERSIVESLMSFGRAPADSNEVMLFRASSYNLLTVVYGKHSEDCNRRSYAEISYQSELCLGAKSSNASSKETTSRVQLL
jgi:hypothetical protein